MRDARKDRSEPIELVRSDLRGLWLLLVPAVIVGPVAKLFGVRLVYAAMFAAIWGAGPVALILWIRWAVGRNAIFADDTGLIVVTRGRASRTHPWDRVRSASWYGGSFSGWWDPGGIFITEADGNEAGRSTLVGALLFVLPRARREAGARVDAYIRTRIGGTP